MFWRGGDKESVDFIMSLIEDLEMYADSYFWDVDFQLLDTLTENEIKKSPLNKAMGIMSDCPQRYILMPDELKNDSGTE